MSERLDIVLMARHHDFSRSRIKGLIEAGFVKVNGEVVAEKIMTVEGGSWRVVQMDITVDAPGEYTIEIGEAVNTIKIAE